MSFKVKRVLDITQPIYHNCPGNPVFPLMKVQKGKTFPTDGFNCEIIETYTHVGSHIDAPIHLLEVGHTVDEYPIYYNVFYRTFDSIPTVSLPASGRVGERF